MITRINRKVLLPRRPRLCSTVNHALMGGIGGGGGGGGGGNGRWLIVDDYWGGLDQPRIFDGAAWGPTTSLPAGLKPDYPFSNLTRIPTVSDLNGGLLIVGSGSGGEQVGAASLNDGTDWSLLTYSATGLDQVYHARYTGGYFVAINAVPGYSGAPQYLYSADPTTGWVMDASLTGTGASGLGDVCAHSDGYIYAALNEDASGVGPIYRRPSLTTGVWERVKDGEIVGYTFHGPIRLVSNGSRLVAMNADGRMSYTDNGTTWTPFTATALSNDGNGMMTLIHGGGYYVAVSMSGGKVLYIAGDDLIFTSHTLGVTTPEFTKFNDICFGGGKFMAAGDGGVVYEFTTPATFTLVEAGFSSSANLMGVAYLGP